MDNTILISTETQQCTMQDIAKVLKQIYSELLKSDGISRDIAENYYLLWDSYILKHEKDNLYNIPLTSPNCLYYKFERVILSRYTVVLDLNISALHLMAINNPTLLSIVKLPLNQWHDQISYIHYANCDLIDNPAHQPILGLVHRIILKPDNRVFPIELIDGNHRVSAAIDHNLDLDIQVIQASILPPQAFRYPRADWILYNMLAGADILTGLYRDSALYLQFLQKVLQ